MIWPPRAAPCADFNAQRNELRLGRKYFENIVPVCLHRDTFAFDVPRTYLNFTNNRYTRSRAKQCKIIPLHCSSALYVLIIVVKNTLFNDKQSKLREGYAIASECIWLGPYE